MGFGCVFPCGDPFLLAVNPGFKDGEQSTDGQPASATTQCCFTAARAGESGLGGGGGCCSLAPSNQAQTGGSAAEVQWAGEAVLQWRTRRSLIAAGSLLHYRWPSFQ